MISKDLSFELINGKLCLRNKPDKIDANNTQKYAISSLLDNPFSVYILDAEGRTLIINDFGADVCGFGSVKKSFGKSLFDVSKGDAADRLISNCNKVITTESLHIFDEVNIRKDNVASHFLSVKLPWYNQDMEINGSVGFSIVLEENNLSASLFKLVSLGLMAPDKITAPEIQSFATGGVKLTRREQQCLKLTMRQLTAKQIARELNISYRTVEDYINNLKRKFAVTSKQELIQKMISLNSNVPL